jgi:hypothetical protein
MSTPFSDRLRAAAFADSTLQSLLGTPLNRFRFYNRQLVQGSAFPAVVFQQISGSDSYVDAGRQATGFSRYQFTIWADNQASAQAVDAALTAFTVTFNSSGVPGLSSYPNYILLRREGLFAPTDPGKYLQTLDVSFWQNDTL